MERTLGLARSDAQISAADPVDDEAAVFVRCLLPREVTDASENDSLRTHVSELLARWRAPVADAYTRFGAPQAEAEAHATILMAALKGALLLAGAQRKIEPLDSVERFFASRAPDPRRA